MTLQNFENMYMRTLCLNGKELNQENNKKNIYNDLWILGMQFNLLSNNKKFIKRLYCFLSRFIRNGAFIPSKGRICQWKWMYKFFCWINWSLRKSKNINKFYICGHSLGGYFAGQYSIKYPEYLEDTIFLVSPTGIGNPEKGGDCNENTNFGQKLVFKGNFGSFKMKPRIQSLKNNFISGYFVKNKCKKRYDIPQDEADLIGQVNLTYLDYPKDLDDCIFILFKYPIPTMKISLEDL